MSENTRDTIAYSTIIYLLVLLFVLLFGSADGNQMHMTPTSVRYAVLWPMYVVRSLVWVVLKAMDSFLFPSGFLWLR